MQTNEGTMTMTASTNNTYIRTVAQCEESLNALSNFALGYARDVTLPRDALTYDFERECGTALFANLLDTFARPLGKMRCSRTIREALSGFYTEEALTRLYRIQTRTWFWNVIGYTASDYLWRGDSAALDLPLDIDLVNRVLANFVEGRLVELRKFKGVREELAQVGLAGLTTSSILCLISIGVLTLSPTSTGEMKAVLNGIFDTESQLLA